jgi:HK97 family phage major capsid protein
MTAAKKILERRANVWEQAKALADRAADENRNFTGEEQASWDSMNAEIDALDVRAKAIEAGEKRAADAAAAMGAVEGRQRPADSNVAELRSFLRGETRQRAFRVEARDLASGTGSAGGDTIPTDFYGRLYEHMVENSAVLQTNPTVLRTSGGNPLELPKTLTHSTGAIVAEAGTFGESDPTFDKYAMSAFKYGRIIQVPSELLEDTGVDLEGYLARQVGRALGNTFGAHLVTGTGTSQPRGVVTDATVGKTGPTGTTTTFGTQSTVGQGFDLLIDTFHSVISPYRNSASCYWLLNDTTAALVRKIKSSEGVYAWTPSVVAGQPDLILGKRVVIDPNVASPAANAKSIVFGDFSAYHVRLAGGFEFVRSDDFAFDQDLVTFRARMRGDGALLDLTGAVKVFQHSAT